MAKVQFKGKSGSVKLNYKPLKVPAGLSPREVDLYNRFYSSVESCIVTGKQIGRAHV